ncbi:unnamed protein product [Prorocentrum cordatum]|uniref:Uncharacterized protein n=1 Tax=Prorocentrum cordatum TaxID=2364126 RepID=A0ABN9QBA0_9DINO|nr:unnamed protein product [Polarella glacialis]|mmetsp:Transcript_13093/g.34864  ORF Transcript_13093/g.34864 Transcript_13093/m.34864 type:complete len:116 (-) Transcript_13093:123-470(-)
MMRRLVFFVFLEFAGLPWLASAVALQSVDMAAEQQTSQERKVSKAKTGTVHAAKRRMRAGLVDATWTPAAPWGHSAEELAKVGGVEDSRDDLEERATSSYFVHRLKVEVNETTAE